MIAYEQFLTWLIPQAPGCTDPVAIDALRDTCIEFCTNTGWLVYEHDPITVLANIRSYELEPPSDHVVSQVLQARLDGAPLSPLTLDDLDRVYGDWRDATGTPRGYTHFNPTEIVLYPLPTERMTNALKLIVNLTPSRDSDEVEDSLYEWWSETIIDGALARLMTLPGQPFSNPQQAAQKQLIFRSGMSAARARRAQSLTKQPQRVQMRSFI